MAGRRKTKEHLVTHLSRLQKLNVVRPYLRALPVVADVVQGEFVRHADGVPGTRAGIQSPASIV